MATELKSTNILWNIFWSGTATVCTYQEITHFQTTWNNLGWPVITRSVTINDSKRTLKPNCEKVKWSKSKRSHQSGTHGKTTPWFAPGTAPVYGACGTLGGWETFSDFGLGRGPEYAIFWEGPEHAVYWEGPECNAMYPGGLRAATTMGRVTLGTAAVATVTGLPSARTQRNTIGLGRYRSLSGLLGPFR